MLAYVFWHRHADGAAVVDYEAANLRFQRSLAANPPGGFVASACLRAERLPWLGDGGPGYEDWYLVEDFSALGVLNEAAAGRGHKTPHDAAAKLMGEGTGGVYRMLDGMPGFAGVKLATWIAPARGSIQPLIEDFLADGMDREQASLWQRQLVLGPAPELCLLAGEQADGVRATRLAAGWRASADAREPL